jgi:hypothetical protein
MEWDNYNSQIMKQLPYWIGDFEIAQCCVMHYSGLQNLYDIEYRYREWELLG